MNHVIFILCIVIILVAVHSSSLNSSKTVSYIRGALLGAGIVLASLIMSTQNANAMHIDIIEHNEVDVVITAVGAIERGDADYLYMILRSMSERYPDAEIRLELQSPGGDALEGWALAYAIRDFNVTTIVPQNSMCASACTYAFMGGTKRTLEGTLGYHLVWYTPIYDHVTPEFALGEFLDGQLWGVFVVSEMIKFSSLTNSTALSAFIMEAYKYAKNNNNNILRLTDPKKCKDLGICK